MQNEDISKDELQAELDAMEASGKHFTPRKSINRKVRGNINVKKLSLIILGLVLLLTFFVLITTMAVEADRESELRKKSGYIIKIVDENNYYGESGGQSGQNKKESPLTLAFDPTFDKSYFELVGLGYGDVGRHEGGSLFADLELNTTMFKKFKEFAEDKDAASIYKKDEGSYNFDEYYCNKYYLKNTSNETVYYRLNLEITENINNALDAARFMIVTGDEYITNDQTQNYHYQIFATPDKEGNQVPAATRRVSTSTFIGDEYFTNPNDKKEVASRDIEDAWLCENLTKDSKTGFYHYYSTMFSESKEEFNNEKALKEMLYKLEPGETVCYTICIWFEGSDLDHNNSIIGGGIKFSVNYETMEYLQLKHYEESKQNN